MVVERLHTTDNTRLRQTLYSNDSNSVTYARTLASSSWGSWVKISNDTSEYGGDLNDLKITCTVYTNSNTTNKPDSNNYYVEVVRQSVNYILQRATFRTTSNVTTKIYQRELHNGTWYSWIDVSPPASSTSSSGAYVKFPDGTMICYGYFEVPANTTFPYEVSLPATFIEDTTASSQFKYGVVTFTNAYAHNGNLLWLGSIKANGKMNVRAYIANTGQAPTTVERATYQAIGRWK